MSYVTGPEVPVIVSWNEEYRLLSEEWNPIRNNLIMYVWGPMTHFPISVAWSAWAIPTPPLNVYEHPVQFLWDFFIYMYVYHLLSSRVLLQEYEFAVRSFVIYFFLQVLVLLIPQVRKRRSCLDQSCCPHTKYHHAPQRTVCTASLLSRQSTQTCAPTTSRLTQESSWCSG